MTPPDLIRLFITPLNGLGVPYMVTGAVAAIVYGEPRLTRDIDVVIALTPADAPRLAAAFADPAFYVTPAEVIAEESRRNRGHFNIVHIASAMKADLYAAGSDPLHAWAMARRESHDVAGTPVSLAPPEYVILRKLEWYRDGRSPRHLDDIRARAPGQRLACEPRNHGAMGRAAGRRGAMERSRAGLTPPAPDPGVSVVPASA